MATLCVGPTSNGSATGADWNNRLAFSTVNGSGWVRGNTYYLMEGTYAGMGCNTAVSGTTLITIKKAYAADHGPATGWLDSMGDGQAIFAISGTNQIGISFGTSYWLVDGQYRSEASYTGWSSETAYGFYVQHTGDAEGCTLYGSSTQNVGNYTVKYVAGTYEAVDVTFEGTFSLVCGAWDGANITVSRCLGRNPSWKGGFQPIGTTDYIIEYCMLDKIGKKEGIQSQYDTRTVCRWSWWRDCGGTGLWVPFGNGTSTDSKFYGNIVEFGSDDYFNFSDALIGHRTAHPEEVLNNWLIYNNTFIRIRGASTVGPINASSTGGEGRNNLWLDSTESYQNLTTSNNLSTTDDTYFVSTTTGSGDYHLAKTTATGYTLGSPYNTDLEGNARTTWSLGALEYNGSPATPARTCGFLLTPVA
jgi:hypothetical protein